MYQANYSHRKAGRNRRLAESAFADVPEVRYHVGLRHFDPGGECLMHLLDEDTLARLDLDTCTYCSRRPPCEEASYYESGSPAMS